jgi:hypothetical protein
MTTRFQSLPAKARQIIEVTATSLALGVAGTAWAQSPPSPAATPSPKAAMPDPAVEAAFKRADVNADGKLSSSEATAIPALDARFGELDKDKDGMLTMTEFSAGVSVRK